MQSFGPGLTPTGRNFKLNGYTQVGQGRENMIPLSGMIRGSYTHRDHDQPDGAAPRFGKNNNATIDEAAVFFGGRIFSKGGAFIEGVYDGVENKVLFDNTDIRIADHVNLGNNNFVFGVSANNSPTVSDLWNTTPVWGFPSTSSPLAPTQSAGALIESMGTLVGGMTAYMMWNNLLYIEAGGYTSFSRTVQKGMNTFDSEQNKINGGAPYWRVAVQKDWNGHYAAIGSFGLSANVNPQRNPTSGTDEYVDFGFDATYQYLANPAHIFEFNATYIRENRNLNASVALGLAEKPKGSLDILRFRTTYTYQQTYGLGLFFDQTTGKSDHVIYSPDPISGSLSGKPNTQAFTAEPSYTPFGKSTTISSTFVNLRIALQYVQLFPV